MERDAFPSFDRAKTLTANVLPKEKEVISNVYLHNWPVVIKLPVGRQSVPSTVSNATSE